MSKLREPVCLLIYLKVVGSISSLQASVSNRFKIQPRINRFLRMSVKLLCTCIVQCMWDVDGGNPSCDRAGVGRCGNERWRQDFYFIFYFAFNGKYTHTQCLTPLSPSDIRSKWTCLASFDPERFQYLNFETKHSETNAAVKSCRRPFSDPPSFKQLHSFEIVFLYSESNGQEILARFFQVSANQKNEPRILLEWHF